MSYTAPPPLLLLVAVSIFAFVVFLKKWMKPVVEGVPIVKLWKFRKNFPAVNEHIANLVAEHNAKLVGVDIGVRSSVIVTHPDTAKEILKNTEQYPKKGIFKSLFGSLVDDSLLFINGENWKHQRAAMSPAFNFDFLRGLMPLMIEKTDQLIAKLPKGEDFDLKPWLSYFTIDVLGVTSFNFDFDTIAQGENSEYYAAYQHLIYHSRKSIRGLLPPRYREMLPLAENRRAYEAKAKMLEMSHKVIELRRADPEKKYLIDMILDAEPPLTMSQIEKNMFLFFVAGHETTAGALTWLIYLLAKHQDVQNRLRDEVDRVLGGKHITPEIMKELTYLDMVIKEVLRYGSPIPFIVSRTVLEDIEIDNHVIPKGTPVGLGIHAIHHNPAIWKDPYVFNPDRFADETRHHPFAFLPFSLGKRVCIGNQFSLMEQRIFITMLLQRFVITAPSENYEKPLQYDLNSVSYGPAKVNITLTRRHTSA